MDLIQGRMDIAVEYGADVAIFVHNIAYWVEGNAANGTNFHDGRYWTFNSLKAWSEVYPLWSRDQVKRLITKCKDAGLILVGNYNKNERDRTQWYTLSDKVLVLYGLRRLRPEPVAESPHHVAESPRPCGENATTLPSIYQEDTQEAPCSPPEGDAIKPKDSKKAENKSAPKWNPEMFARFWALYPRGEAKQKAAKAWDKLQPDDTLLRIMSKALKGQIASREWQEGVGVPYASTWLNNRRWEDETQKVSDLGAMSERKTYHVEVIDGEEVNVYD